MDGKTTQHIRLMPFSLRETEAYLQAKNIHFNRYQLLQLYMTIGGIPHYLNAVQRGLSVQQVIEQSYFHKDGVLYHEFNNLYYALFNNAATHIVLIRALASRPMGLTRAQLLEISGLRTGGGVTSALDELEESGFIVRLHPFGKKLKDTLFRLADEYSYFYLRFIENKTLRLLKRPLPEEDFQKMRRLAVQLLGDQLDELIDEWEDKNNITEDYYFKFTKTSPLFPKIRFPLLLG